MANRHLNLDERQYENIPGITHEYPYKINCDDYQHYSYVPWHWHEEVELNYVESGAVDICTPDNVYHVKAGEACFINSNVMMSKRKASDEDTIVKEHIFHTVLLSGHFHSVYEMRYVRPVTYDRGIEVIMLTDATDNGKKALKEMRELFDDVTRDGGEPYIEFHVRRVLSKIWEYMLRDMEEQGVNRAEVDLPGQERIRSMMTYIQRHFAEKISLADIAESAGVSERECVRSFRRNLNMTPFEYVTRHRLNVSRKLLAETDEPITDIATEVGFSGAAYYGKIFRERFEMTPSEYRKKSIEESEKNTE